MTRFEQAFEWIIRAEGGYVNLRHDPGGATKYGISQRAYPKLDIAALTPDDAREIYRRDYWLRCRCDELPVLMDLAVFDAAVNQGPLPAVRLLQECLDVAVDGKVGPITLKATLEANSKTLMVRYLAGRAVYYAALPTARWFLTGWMRRLFDLQQALL